MFKKCITAFGVLAISGAALLLSPATTFAQHHGGGGHGGGHGGNWSGGHGGSWNGGHGGSNFWWGFGTGLAVSPYVGGYYGGYGGYYPYYGRYYSPYYYSAYYYSDVVPDYGDNVTYSSSAYTPAMNTADDRARLTIRVPSDRADVWIEGEQTTQAKRTENYVSPPLTPGKKYHYEVRARWTDRDGKTMDETRTFPIYAGSPVMVDFSRPAPNAQSAKPPRE